MDLIANQQLWQRGFFPEASQPDGTVRPIVGPGARITRPAEICDDAPIDVTVGGEFEDEVIELVDIINENGGEASWDYADSDSDDDDEEDDDDDGNLAVVLSDAGRSKLQVVKIVKEMLGIGLAEAKNYVDSAPVTIPVPGADSDDIDAMVKMLEDAGASAYGTTV